MVAAYVSIRWYAVAFMGNKPFQLLAADLQISASGYGLNLWESLQAKKLFIKHIMLPVIDIEA